jgi:2-keto-3-deoxy-L-rhamnonate aldolase RhmA
MTADRLLGSIGTWVKLPTIESVQILAYTGWDFVVVDQEHAPIDDRTMYQLVATAHAEGVFPLVRVDQLRGPTVQRVLDAGAAGIMIPHIDTPEQAADAVRAMRFPPVGTRGAGGTSRAGRWGMLPSDEYLRVGNEDILLIVQLESLTALTNATAIARVPGVDFMFIGPADLSLDMGGQPGSPAVVDAYLTALESIHGVGALCGIASATGPGAAAALAQGFDFVLASSDAALFAYNAAAVLAEARQGTA